MTAGRVVGAALALVAVVLAGCSGGYTDGARPGRIADGGVDTPAHKAVVQLPLGPLSIAVGTPSQQTNDYHQIRAADGATWVPVSWTLGGNGADYDNNTPAFQFQVTLVADHRRYSLQAGQATDPDDAASEYAPIVKEKSLDVAVQGDGTHLQAEIEYDGVTQTVDFDSGRITKELAAPLYPKGAPHTALTQTSCSYESAADARRFRVSSYSTCTVGPVQTVPYVGGLGWVSSTRQAWTLVPLDMHLIEIDDIDGEARYSNFDLRQVRVTVDGTSPTTEILRYRSADRLDLLRSGVLVVRTSSAPKSLRIELTVRAENEYRRGQFHTFRSERTYRLG